MAQAMKGVTKAMGTMNRQLKLPQIQKIMMEFERQAEIMDMKEEMMNDAIDDAMGDEEDEEERCETLTGRQGYLPGPLPIRSPDEFFFFPSDAVVSQVLDELGLSLTDELSSECSKSTYFPTQSSATTQSTALDPQLSLQTFPPLEAHSVWQLVGRKQRPQPQPWLMLMQTWKRGSRTFAGTENTPPQLSASCPPVIKKFGH